MAEIIDLDINIGANTTDLQSSLQKAENLLLQFQNALKKATNVGEINYLNNQIRNLNGTISGIRTQMQGMARPTSDATNALSNLSRVAQDAPYGFIGIANNLNPLLESFQRLQKETGSSSKALMSMVEGLSGAGGLGLALAAISSLAVVFSDDIKRAFEGPADKIKELREEIKKLNQDLYKVAGSAQASQTLGTTLVGKISDQTLDINVRKNALKQLKDLYTQNKQIQDLQIKDINNYNVQFLQSLNNKAAIQQLELSKEKNYVDALSSANASYKKLIEERDNIKKNTYATTKQLEMGTTTAQLRSQIDAQFIKPLQAAQKEIERAKASLNRTIDNVLDFDYVESKSGEKSSIKKSSKAKSQSFDVTAALRARVKSDNLLAPMEVAPVDTAIADAKKQYEDYLKWLSDQTKWKEDLALKNIKKEQKDLEELQKSYEQFAQTIAGTVTNALFTMYDAIEQGENPLQAIGQMFANIARQIAAAVVQALIFQALLEAFPALKGAFAALGTVNSAFGIGKGMSALNSGVSSSSTFNSSGIASIGNQTNGQFVIKGNDLVLALQRSNSSLNLIRG